MCCRLMRLVYNALSVGITTPVSASIGIAVYPDAGTNLAQLLEKADQALYAAKHAGRKTCCVAESSYKQP